MKHYSRIAVALLSICLCFGLIACTPFGGFKPPPPWWSYFKGNGASEEEIRIALLECGSDVPGDPMEFLTVEGKFFYGSGVNNEILATQCMINSGFRYKRSVADLCANATRGIRDVPACKSDALIPKRSVENRLNSAYCKMYPRVRICQSVVVSEAQWSEMNKEEREAQRRRRQPMLDALHKEGYRTVGIAMGEIDYCIRQTRKNTPAQGKLMPYFEKCMKEERKAWYPEFCARHSYRAVAYAVCAEVPEDDAKMPESSTLEKKD